MIIKNNKSLTGICRHSQLNIVFGFSKALKFSNFYLQLFDFSYHLSPANKLKVDSRDLNADSLLLLGDTRREHWNFKVKRKFIQVLLTCRISRQMFLLIQKF